jgi:hypothetical protein
MLGKIYYSILSELVIILKIIYFYNIIIHCNKDTHSHKYIFANFLVNTSIYVRFQLNTFPSILDKLIVSSLYSFNYCSHIIEILIHNTFNLCHNMFLQTHLICMIVCMCIWFTSLFSFIMRINYVTCYFTNIFMPF